MTLYISLTSEDIEKLRNDEEVESISPQGCIYDNLQGVIMLNEEAFNRKFKKEDNGSDVIGGD